jgi:prepilin peptidase CpaA
MSRTLQVRLFTLAPVPQPLPLEVRVYQLALLTVFPAAVIFAAAWDLFSMTIPNRISLALVAGFFCIAPFSGLSLEDIGMHVLAGLLILSITVAMFAFNCIGGGDAKLAAAVALWFGFGDLMTYVFTASMFGGLLSLAFLAFRQVPLPYEWARAQWIQRLHTPRGGIPYGIALSAAALVVYHQSFWLRGLSS